MQRLTHVRTLSRAAIVRLIAGCFIVLLASAWIGAPALSDTADTISPQAVSPNADGAAVSRDPAANPGGMPPERSDIDRGPIPSKIVIPPDISKQSKEDAAKKSAGCLSAQCHVGIEDMHTQGLSIGCIDCHGGNASATTKEAAH